MQSAQVGGGVLAEAEPRIHQDRIRADPGRPGGVCALDQKAGDLVHRDLAAARLRLLRRQAEVGHHDARTVTGDRGRHPGVGEAGVVVHEIGPRPQRGIGHRGTVGVDRDRHIQLRPQPEDDGLDPRDLLVLGKHLAGLRRHPTDIDDPRTGPGQLDPAGHRRVGRRRQPPVIERVGRRVDDAHHARWAVQGQGAVGEAQPHGRPSLDGSAGMATIT